MRLRRAPFFEAIHYHPHPGQAEVHQSRASVRVVGCGRRWGKSMCAAAEATAAMAEPREFSRGWVVAPTYTLAEKVFREIERYWQLHFPHRILKHRVGDFLQVANLGGGLSEVTAKSADNLISLLGEGLDWLIIDEAAFVRPKAWTSFLQPTLLDRNGWALLISTPNGMNWFYGVHRLARDYADHASWNMPSWTNPHVSRDWIERKRATTPEQIFAQEYGAEFREGAGAVFRGVRECATGAFRAYDPHNTYVAGLDLAKVQDFTVLTVLDAQRRLVFADRFNRIPWPAQKVRIKESLRRYNNPRTAVDAGGPGSPIYDDLAADGWNVIPVPFTMQSKGDMVTNLSMMFERRSITLPADWDVGLEELESFMYTVTDRGHVSSAAPPGLHDDCVDSLMLAAWLIRESAPMVGISVI